jgi:hypothetical protein
MKKMTWMRGALALTVMLGASPALAADHLDAPAVKADASEDITDLFAWVDGADTVLILNTYPSATATTQFSNTLQYVFHTQSAAAYGATATPLNIIATFDAAQNISVWVGATDYVTGKASATTGLTSASGNFKVFAGLVDDPFFFNLTGFHDVEADVEAAASSLVLNAAGCPAVDALTSAALVADVGGTNHGTSPAVDYFSPSAGYSGNVLSIVLSIKTSLLTSGGPIVGVWASTNVGG